MVENEVQNMNNTSSNQGFVPVWESPSGVLKPFGEVNLPKFKLKAKTDRQYYIYKDKNEFELVEADTVIEAINSSEVKEPYKISHTGFRLDTVIEEQMLEFLAGEPSQEDPEADVN